MNNSSLFPCKVLVVDEEPDVQYLIEQQFAESIKSQYLQFLFARDATQALKILSSDPTLIVVLADINLPFIEGLKLLQTISQNFPLIKTVIVSSYGDMEIIRKSMQKGAFDFIIKPFDFTDLNATLLRAIQVGLTERKTDYERTCYLNLKKELEVASQIQQTLIPHSFIPLPCKNKYELYGQMIPAVAIAGDFFDFFPLSGHQLAFVIGDVSGKGVPEALTMAVARTSVRCFAPKAASLMSCLYEVNSLLCQDNTSSTFVTLLYSVLDLNTGLFNYCNAGHLPPLLISEDGTVEALYTTPCLALGLSENISLFEFSRQLKKNDIIFFYTDGVNEAMNMHYVQYSQPRLEAKLKELYQEPLEVLVDRLLEDIRLFTKGREQSDDITVLCLRYTPSV
jgi:phosphoserine phosphatase RsbU/P